MPDAVFLIATLRRALQRRAVRRAIVAIIAVGTAFTVSSLLASVERARDRWGDTRPVAVALRDLSPGEVVDSAVAAMEDRPVGLVGEETLAALPTGATVRYPIQAGEPLVPNRLAPQGLTGVAALVPPGHRAIAIPATQLGIPPLTPGIRVDVVVVSSAVVGPVGSAPMEEPSTPAAPAFTLAPSALVVAVEDDAVAVAVPENVSAQVAYAVATGTVILTLTPD